MHVLVTRPQPDAAETAARLEAAGHAVTIDSVLDVASIPDASIPDRPYQAILVTSSNAPRALRERADLGRLARIPLVAVGKRTAERSAALGFDARASDGGVPALAAKVIAEIAPASGPLLYLAGRDRTGDLEGKLRSAGFEVDLVEVYTAEPAATLEPATIAALDAGRIDVALFASRRTVEAFLAAARASGVAGALQRVDAACLSAQVAAAIPPGAFRSVRVAEAATEAALVMATTRDASQDEPAIVTSETTGGEPMAARKDGDPKISKRIRPPTIEGTATPVAAAPPGILGAAAPATETARTEQAPTPTATAATATSDASPPPHPVPRTPASTPQNVTSAPSRASAPPPRGSSFGSLVGAGLVGAAGAAVIFLLAGQAGLLRLGPADTGETRALTERLAALEAQTQRIGALERAIPALEPRIGTGERAANDLVGLVGRIEQMGGAGRDGAAAVAAARAEIERLSTLARDLEARLATVANTPATPAVPETVTRDLGALRQALGALETRVGGMDLGGLSRALEETRRQVGEIAARPTGRLDRVAGLAVAAAGLKAAIDRGGAYKAELDALRAFGVEGIDLAALTTRAERGVPTTAALGTRFAGMARGLVDAALPTPTGTLDALMQQASRLVSIRPSGEPAGPDVASIVARVETRLRQGDAVAALAEFRALPQVVRTAAGGFGDDLAARVEADSLMAAVTKSILDAAPRG